MNIELLYILIKKFDIMEKKKYYIVYQITNKLNNKIYIGIHVTENIKDKYMGSGSNIKKAIKEFGIENFEKIVLFNFDNKEEMLEKEKELVNDEFIKNGNTYNVILGGGGFNSYNLITVRGKDGNTLSAHKTDPRYLSGELVSIQKGIAIVRDKNDNIFQVSVDDPRYLSGEFIPHNKGKNLGSFAVKDKYNNKFQVSVDDPRYISGELLAIWTGKKHNEETKRKIGEKNSILQKGDKNSQFDTCWIYNLNIKESKKIKNSELDKWISNGWIKGRKMKF